MPDHIESVGNHLYLHKGSDVFAFYPSTTGRWIASRALEVAPPPPEEPPATPAPTDPPPATGGPWTHPLPGATLTSGYGFRQGYDQPGLIHAGVDLSTTTAAAGGWIVAPFDMEITQALEAGGTGFADAGTFVKGITRSGTPYTISFFHGSPGSLSVKKGDKVAKGTRLMREGQSGYAFGTHLHLEIWPGHVTTGFRFDSPWYYGDGTPTNPVPIFSANGVNL